MSELGENGTKCSGISVFNIQNEKEITNGEVGAPSGGSMSALQTSRIAPPPPGAPPQPSAPPQPPPSETDTANGQLGKRNATNDEICKDYLRGVCSRKVCKYKHEPRNKALGKDTVIFCHDHQNKGCPRPFCKFIHCTEEEENHFYMTGELPICKDFVIEECLRGSECMYRHETQDNNLTPKDPFPTIEKVEVETTVPEENGVGVENVWNSPPPPIPPSMHCIPLPPHPPPSNPPAPPPPEQQPTESVTSDDISLPQLSMPPPSIPKPTSEISSTYNHVNIETNFPAKQDQSFNTSYDKTVPPPNMWSSIKPNTNAIFSSQTVHNSNHISMSSNQLMSKKRPFSESPYSSDSGRGSSCSSISTPTNFVNDFEEKSFNSEMKTMMIKPQYMFSNAMINKESRLTSSTMNSKACSTCKESEKRNREMEKNMERVVAQISQMQKKLQELKETNSRLTEIKKISSNATMETSLSDMISNDQFSGMIKLALVGLQDSPSQQLNFPGSLSVPSNSGPQMVNLTNLFGQILQMAELQKSQASQNTQSVMGQFNVNNQHQLQNSQASQNTQSVMGQFNVNNQHQGMNLTSSQQLLSTPQSVDVLQQALAVMGNQLFNSSNQQISNQVNNQQMGNQMNNQQMGNQMNNQQMSNPMNNQQINNQQINLAQPALLSQNQAVNEDNFYGNSTQHITAQLIQRSTQSRGNSSNSQSQNPLSYMTQNTRQ